MRSFLLGERTEVESWRNPYVTDGLLAMWDAEWNEAGGVHDSDSMRLNDLAGNLPPISAAELGDDWMTMTSTFDVSAATYPAIVGVIGEDGYRHVTVEGCTSFDPGVTGVSGYKYGLQLTCNIVLNGTTYSPSSGFGVASGADGFGFNQAGITSRIVSAVPVADGRRRTFSFPIDQVPDGVSVAYIDGESYRTYTWNSSTTAYGRNVTSARVSAPGSAYAAMVRHSCIRIYSRALTGAEVAANYAVDARRFGT